MKKICIVLLVSLFIFNFFGVAYTKKIKMSMWGTPQEEAVYKEITKAFEAKYPDIKVKVSVLSWTDYWSGLQTRLASGSAPDVFAVNGGWLQVFASKNVIKNITPYVDKEKSLLSDIFPMAVETFKYKGKIYGLPRDFNTYVVFYNKDLFDKYGVSYPKSNWSWDDYLATAKALTKDINGDGRIDTWGVIVDTRPDVWMPFVWQNGGDVLNSDKTKSVINSKETKGAFQFLKDLILKYKASPTLSQQQAFGWNPFGSGKIGMYITGKWMVPIYKSTKFKWDIQVLPRGKKQFAIANSVGFVIYKNSKYSEETYKYIKFIATEGQKYLLKLGSSVPCSRTAVFSRDFLNSDEPPANKRAFIQEIPYSKILPFHPKWNELWEVWTKYPKLMFDGKISVKEGLLRMDKDMNKILQEK